MPAPARPALLPFSDGVIPTTLDKTLNPDGTHIMSLFTQWVPAEWADAPHTEELDAYADRLIDLYDQVAPGFKSSIMHRDIVGPHEMEQEYGLIGGNIFHGELSLEQLFHMRPAPATPTTARRSPGCTTAVRPPTPAAACAVSPVGRRHERRWPTRSRATAGSRGAGQALLNRSEAGRDRGELTRRAAVAAMLGARSMAVVGASPRPAASGRGWSLRHNAVRRVYIW